MAVDSLKDGMVYLSMGKASRKKKKVGEISGFSRAKLEDEQIGLASKAASPNLIIVAALVAIVTFAVFLPALQNDFVYWDDNAYVYENSFIRAIDAKLFKSAFFSFYAGNWHPLTWISHAIDYAIWGLNPLGHHLTNVILHALNALIVVLLVVRLMEVYKKTVTDNKLSGPFLNERTILITAAVTGLLFGLHPVHAESVAWIAERKDLLSALFFLLSITMYTKYVSVVDNGTVRKGSVSRFFIKQYLFTIGFFILALLSKPMAVTLPFVLLILDRYPFHRIRSLKTFGSAFVEKLPFIALCLISSILTILAQKAGEAIQSMEFTPLSTRALVAAKSVFAYIWKMILPLHLVPFYPYPTNVSLLSIEYFLPVVLLIGITIICVLVAKKQKLWLSVWSYYLLTLIPVLGIVQVGGQAMADRYTYLPSLGPFLVMGLVTALTLKMASVVVAIAALMSVSYITIQQVGVWKNGLVLWNYVIEKEPGRVPLAHNNLGNVYQSKGQFAMAIEQYQTALRLKPDYAEAHYNLGIAYKSKGQLDMAIEQYQTALRLDPENASARNNLANIYASQGLSDKAAEEYQSASRRDPENAAAHYNLGLAYASKGQLDKAVAEYQTALRLNPENIQARNNLGVSYGAQGLPDRAIAEFQAVLRQKPDFVEARYNLAFTYLNKGNSDLARRELEVILNTRPDFNAARQLLNSINSVR